MSAEPPPVSSGLAVPTAAELSRLLATGPMGSLLAALEDRPGMGWMLKDAATLRYALWRGSVPQSDPALCSEPAVSAGQGDSDRFERSQAGILRLADLRVLQQGRPATEDHRFETLPGQPGEGVREWRSWRCPVGPWLLVVWTDLGAQARQDEQLEQLRRQLQAQQLLIAELRGWGQASPGTPASEELARQSQGWAVEHFQRQLLREVDLSQREHRSLALLLIEIGGQALSERGVVAAMALVAQILRSGTRAMDTIAQIDTHRFGVLLSGAALTPAYARAEALRRQACSQQIMLDGQPSTLALSIGLATHHDRTRGADQLMAAAGQALQEALSKGGDRTVIARVDLGQPPDQPAADARQSM